MTRLKKFILLVILQLLLCSTSLCQNNNDWDQGDCPNDDWASWSNDSVLIPIEVIRAANAKMIELKYEKQINENLREVVRIDSTIISSLNNNIIFCEAEKETLVGKYKKQRNNVILIGSTTSAILLTLLIVLL